jgi:hypothetical protein
MPLTTAFQQYKVRRFRQCRPEGCYVFEVTDSIADDLRWKFRAAWL